MLLPSDQVLGLLQEVAGLNGRKFDVVQRVGRRQAERGGINVGTARLRLKVSFAKLAATAKPK